MNSEQRETQRITCPQQAGSIIREGGLVAFPTETVFGLGVDATNEQAVQRLFAAKGRPSDNPLIVHLSCIGDWRMAAAEFPPKAKKLCERYSPGPLTVVLPKKKSICDSVTAGLPTVGVRIPEHSLAREILRAAGVPVAAPSANLSGRPSGTTWQSVLDDLNGRIDAIVCADAVRIGIESTVVDCTRHDPLILRHGAVSLEEIQRIVPNIGELAIDKNDRVNSPGLLHPHYRPHAQLHLISDGDANELQLGKRIGYCGLSTGALADLLRSQRENLGLVTLFRSVEAYAAGFYEFLREADRQEMSTVFVQTAPAKGVGRALVDRQQRAAGQS